MKHLTIVFIIAIAAFAVGCQDNTVTEPVAASSDQLLKNNPVNQILNLKGDVSPEFVGTHGDGTSFHVIGQVFVSYTIIGSELDPIINFTIATQAELIPARQILPSGAISNSSEYQIPLATKVGVIQIQRDYYVENVGSKLHIVFAVAENNNFSVVSMTMDPFVLTPGIMNIN